MKDEGKIKEQLINGLKHLYQRITALEKSETERKRAEETLWRNASYEGYLEGVKRYEENF